MKLIREQRYLLSKRLEVLSANLTRETDSIRAEQILQEMRNIQALLEELAGQNMTDHEGDMLCQQNVF
ncbi:hypothetical protein [Solibacillus sp.]|uniref:hypothetical protein n=1 Tax=Solibacillus sp. TaxID=1909654 RepID=UPI00331525D9